MSLVSAFNCESDIRPENASSVYYRYSVDEWQHYEHSGFDRSNSLIKQRNAKFASFFPDDEVESDYCREHTSKIHNVVLDALAELKSEGVFGSDAIFLVIWIPDSGPAEIVLNSAKFLNTPTVYDEFASEFDF